MVVCNAVRIFDSAEVIPPIKPVPSELPISFTAACCKYPAATVSILAALAAVCTAFLRATVIGPPSTFMPLSCPTIALATVLIIVVPSSESLSNVPSSMNWFEMLYRLVNPENTFAEASVS